MAERRVVEDWDAVASKLVNGGNLIGYRLYEIGGLYLDMSADVYEEFIGIPDVKNTLNISSDQDIEVFEENGVFVSHAIDEESAIEIPSARVAYRMYVMETEDRIDCGGLVGYANHPNVGEEVRKFVNCIHDIVGVSMISEDAGSHVMSTRLKVDITSGVDVLVEVLSRIFKDKTFPVKTGSGAVNVKATKEDLGKLNLSDCTNFGFFEVEDLTDKYISLEKTLKIDK